MRPSYIKLGAPHKKSARFALENGPIAYKLLTTPMRPGKRARTCLLWAAEERQQGWWIRSDVVVWQMDRGSDAASMSTVWVTTHLLFTLPRTYFNERITHHLRQMYNVWFGAFGRSNRSNSFQLFVLQFRQNSTVCGWRTTTASAYDTLLHNLPHQLFIASSTSASVANTLSQV